VNLAAAIVMLALAVTTLAQTSQPIANSIHRDRATGAEATTQGSSATSLDTGRVALALAAVVGLIVLLRMGIRRFAPGMMGRSSRGIRVIARTYLAPKQQVIVLQVGRRMLVVGDTGQNLSTLCEITDPDEAATLLAQIQGTAAGSREESFDQAMARAGEKYASSESKPEMGDPVFDSARTELNGLAERVRVLSRHLRQA
jgi:flagellar biogenesis protein FliO